MRLVVLLLLASCATATEPVARELPEEYLSCKPRYRHYRCCPRDFKTHELVGDCLNMPRDK